MPAKTKNTTKKPAKSKKTTVRKRSEDGRFATISRSKRRSNA